MVADFKNILSFDMSTKVITFGKDEISHRPLFPWQRCLWVFTIFYIEKNAVLG